MPNFDLSSKADRSLMVEQIQSEENVSRKRNAQRDFDVYCGRQDRYIIEKLQCEFTQKTLDSMRKVLSVSLATRIVNAKASVYSEEPNRVFFNVNDSEDEQLKKLYFDAQANAMLMWSNRLQKMSWQACMMVIPKNGRLMFKPLAMKDYDVIPDCDNPEKAFAYVLNVWDLDFRKSYRTNSYNNDERRYFQNDMMNQKIGDNNDRKKVEGRYVVWTDDFHFTMDERGNFLGEPIPNPIGKLPFIDIPACPKDHQFFVRQGSKHTEFSLDWAVAMSDIGNVVKFQNYSQPIISSEKMPVNIEAGPNRTIWLELDPNRPDVRPTFEFASPSPDITGSLSYVDQLLVSYLTSEGLDPSLISQDKNTTKFSSGIERHLAMIDKFEASREDFALYQRVEDELLDLTVRWNNILQGASDPDTGELVLDEKLQGPVINEKVEVEVKFGAPEDIQTNRERQENVIRLMSEGLMSRKEAIMELRGIDEESAKQVIEEIDEDDEIERDKNMDKLPPALQGTVGDGEETTEGSDEDVSAE